MAFGNAATAHDDKVNWGMVALVVIVFSLLYLTTAVYLGFADKEQERTLHASQLFGPIQTTRSNEVLDVEVVYTRLRESWAYIEADLLDSKKTTLFSFGGNYWHESGRDSDGSWSEAITDQDIRVTVPKPGYYYLRFRVEGGAKNSSRSHDLTGQAKIKVKVRHIKGSHGLLVIFGAIFLVIGVVMNEIQNKTIIRILEKANEED